MKPCSKSVVSNLLIVVYFALAYFVACATLNHVIPRIVETTRTAQQFWIFGVAALAMSSGSFALFKITRNLALSRAQARICKAISIAFEALIFVGAIAIWIEAGDYAAWVGQFETITAHSGVDTRYWISSVLFANGIFGNLLAAILTV